MKRLILLRHGEANPDSPTGDDFDRTLSDNGVSESAAMGRRLVDMGFEDSEADGAIEPAGPGLDLTGGAGAIPAGPAPTVFELAEDVSGFDLSPEEQAEEVRNAWQATQSRKTAPTPPGALPRVAPR